MNSSIFERVSGAHPLRSLIGRLFALTVFVAASLTIGPARSTADDSLGIWSPIKAAGLVSIHMSLLPNGKLVLFDQFSKYRMMDPVTETISPMPMPWYASFCGSNCLLADGRLFVAGGGGGEPSLALEHSGVYNPITDSWLFPPDMNAKRWYSTSITLPTGNVLVSAGAGPFVPMQEYRVDTNTWRTLPGLLGSGYLYPRLFVAPNGLVFNAGPDDETAFFDLSDVGSETETGEMNFGYRIKGSVVMYDTGKLLAVGGALSGPYEATNTCEIIDLNDPNPHWTYTGSMKYARKDVTLVIQPNGKILATGGVSGPSTDNPVYPCEEWDPATGQWKELASIGIARGYHSTSLLIPDGRIVSAGGSKESYQIFTPHYLLNGPRPTISGGPDTVTLGVDFDVTSPNAADIQHVNMIRMATTTHAVNFDQRILRMNFSVDNGTLHITAPTSPNVAVPGYYMLFILNSAGNPSDAKIIKIQQTDLAAPADYRVSVPSRRAVKLNWTDMSRTEIGYVVERRLLDPPGEPIERFDLEPNMTGYVDRTMLSGKPYEYTVKVKGPGNVELSSQTEQVQVPELVPPAQPTNVRAVPGMKAGTIVFTWKDPDDLETNFYVERSLDKLSWGLVATMPANATGFYDAGLTGGTKYYYRVFGHNDAGLSPASGVVGTTAPISDVGLQVYSVSLSPASVAGGVPATGTVTLNMVAPAGDAVVSLSSTVPQAIVPANVTIPEGASKATFPITTTVVSQNVTATISATLGIVKTANLIIKPPAVQSVSATPNSVKSGSGSIGKVTLTGPAPEGGLTVTLSSNKPQVTVPASVFISAEGTTATFPIQTVATDVTMTATISAMGGGANKTCSLTLVRHEVSGVVLTPAYLTGGLNSTATVTINAPARPGGDVVTLASDRAEATVPASVTVLEGMTTATFQVNTTAVQTQVIANISATLNGTKSKALTIKPPSPSLLSLSPSTITGGLISTATVTLNAEAPPGGLEVSLTSSRAEATVPTTVTVPAGLKTATFQVATSQVGASLTATIGATSAGITKTANLTIKPYTVTGLSLTPAIVTGGAGSTGKVTISAVAGLGGVVVTLSSDMADASVPPTVTIPAGSNNVTFPVTTTPVAAQVKPTIKAMIGPSYKTSILTINP